MPMPNLPEGNTLYTVQFTYSGFAGQAAREAIRTRNAIVTDGYTTFENIRKILITSLTGNPDDFDKIDILTVTKMN